MAYLSYHIAKVARWSRIAGTFSVVVFGIIALVLAVVQWNLPAYGSQPVPIGFLIFMWAMLYLVPGALLWIFGRILESGKFWAFSPILVLAVFDLAKVFLFRFALGFGCYIVLRFPTMVLMAFVLNAIPDMRDHYRRWRRERKPRGFPVIVAPRQVATPPPPSRRQMSLRPPRNG